MFNFGRKKTRDKRRSPKEQMPLLGKIVPDIDYELLKQIKISLANGHAVEVSPKSWTNQHYDANAKALHYYYGMSENEVLVETGVWIG